jgi:ABC-type phosphate transport system auxiliary subunit
VAQLESKIQETVAIKEELQRQYASLEDNLKKVEAERMVGGLCISLIPL